MKNNHQIDIPLLFFFFAFFIILFGLFSKLTFQKDSLVQPYPTPQQKNIKTPQKLNYNLPISCDYQTKNSSISAVIDTSSFAVIVVDKKDTQKYIVQGDCLYSWKTSGIKGKKKCGIGSSITLGRQLLSSGVGSIDSLAEIFQKSQGASQVNLQAVFETCENIKEIKKEVFVIPRGVRFE